MIYLYEVPCDPKIISQKVTGPRLNVTHPRLVNFCDYSIEESVNEQIKNLVQQMIQTCAQDHESVMITGRYKINLNTKYLLSLSQEVFSQRTNQETLYSMMKSLNFDLFTGKKLTLPDLFDKESDYEKIFTFPFVVTAEPFREPFPKENDYFLTFKDLVVIINQKEFSIPLLKLKKILFNDSPVKRLLLHL
ncbi:hypothetical protein [Heliorestis convoluta]|uniref:Uncharacterized protein n=1 Tax=Heliorestis convoluta TaxID=356322 RepID=A0A5Q2MVY2_9FIRM|nr:hypothetical protein [Heliorestis convoluta]QGG46388.1 hypothetical protein FTV88_0209 [Heliorestis convoluta]